MHADTCSTRAAESLLQFEPLVTDEERLASTVGAEHESASSNKATQIIAWHGIIAVINPSACF